MARKKQWSPLVVPNGGLNEVVVPQMIGDNQWSAAQNVEPMLDGVRRRRGSSAYDANQPVREVIHSLEEDAGEDFSANSAQELYVSMGFQLSAAEAALGPVGGLAVRIKRVGTGSSPKIAIYSDSGGDPSAAVTDGGFNDWLESSISYLNNPYISTLQYDWWYFYGKGTIVLQPSTQYHIVIQHLTTPDGANYNKYEYDTSNPYANGTNRRSADGSSWGAPVVTGDVNFRIFGRPATIRGIINYQPSDTTWQKHLVAADKCIYAVDDDYRGLYKLMIANSGELTGLNTSYDYDEDELLSWVIGQDRVFYTDNSNPSAKYYALDTGAWPWSTPTAYSEREGLQAPTATPSAGVAHTTVDLPDGDYEIDYYYWNDDIGLPSARRYEGISALSKTTSSQHITLTGLPATTVSVDERATHIRLELKEVGSSIFRYVKDVAIGTTTATITSDDLPTTIEAEYGHAPPLVHAVKCVGANRQFIGDVLDSDGTTRRRYRVMYSAIYGITPYYESFPATNYRDFDRVDGEYVTALFFMPPQTLIVGMKNRVYALDARRPGTSDKYLLSPRAGIAGKLSATVVGDSIYFLSDSPDARGFYKWTMGTKAAERLRGADDTLESMEYTRFKMSSCALLPVDGKRSQWWTLLTTEDGTQHDTIMVYDTVLDAWGVHNKSSDRRGAVLGVVNDSTTETNKMYLGGYDGVEYEQDTGKTDEGTDYTGSVTLKAFDFGDPGMNKRLRGVQAVVAGEDEGEIAVSVEGDYGESTSTGTLDHQSTQTNKIVETKEMRVRGRVLAPTFSGDKPWHIKGVAFDVQPTEKE